MAIWGDIFDTFGGKAITTAIEHVLDGEGGKAIEALGEGAILQEVKDVVIDTVGKAADAFSNNSDN